MKRFFFLSGFSLFAFMVACSSKDTTTTGTTGTTTSSSSTTTTSGGGSGGGVVFPKDSCVQAGEVGNSKGVGHACTPGGHECDAFPNAGLCLADVGQTQWFCTQLGCMADIDCGESASCYHDVMNACIPSKCLNGMGGGGAGGSGGAGGH